MAAVDPELQNLIRVGIVAMPILFGFLYVRMAKRRLRRIYELLEWDCAHSIEKTADVFFTFHTFHGFLIFAVQREHRIRAPYDAAVKMLRRLNRFNWCYSWFALLGPFLPFVSYWNYLGEWDRIKDQHQGKEPRWLK